MRWDPAVISRVLIRAPRIFILSSQSQLMNSSGKITYEKMPKQIKSLALSNIQFSQITLFVQFHFLFLKPLGSNTAPGRLLTVKGWMMKMFVTSQTMKPLISMSKNIYKREKQRAAEYSMRKAKSCRIQTLLWSLKGQPSMVEVHWMAEIQYLQSNKTSKLFLCCHLKQKN